MRLGVRFDFFPCEFRPDLKLESLYESDLIMACVMDRLSMVSCSIVGRQKERRGDTKSTPWLKECKCSRLPPFHPL